MGCCSKIGLFFELKSTISGADTSVKEIRRKYTLQLVRNTKTYLIFAFALQK